MQRGIARTILFVVIARSEATKQSRSYRTLDCFASLAMTSGDHAKRKSIDAHPIPRRLDAMAAHAVPHSPPVAGARDQQCARPWRSCADRRCRRARFCQDHECYWRRLEQVSYDEQMRLREAAAPLARLLWIGCIKGSEGRPRF
jgi:hypothetical protein